jgi:hypothetical protein
MRKDRFPEKGLPIKDLTTDSETFTQLDLYFKD